MDKQGNQGDEKTLEKMLENLWGPDAPLVPPYIDETVRGYIKQAIKSGQADGLSTQTILKIVEFWLSPEPEDLLAATYGPPAVDAPHAIGATLIYDDAGCVENGEILYVATEPELHYIVSPATDAFPTPVWPVQVIAAM